MQKKSKTKTSPVKNRQQKNIKTEKNQAPVYFSLFQSLVAFLFYFISFNFFVTKQNTFSNIGRQYWKVQFN